MGDFIHPPDEPWLWLDRPGLAATQSGTTGVTAVTESTGAMPVSETIGVTYVCRSA
jgi:hypothetical protein